MMTAEQQTAIGGGFRGGQRLISREEAARYWPTGRQEGRHVEEGK